MMKRLQKKSIKIKKKNVDFHFIDLVSDLNYIVRENKISWQMFDKFVKE